MSLSFPDLLALLAHGHDTLIDVRSPAEYAEDHIPGAVSLPALSNEERARVGTIYVQESPFRARKIGAALVARNVAAHLEGPLSDMDGGWRPLVYCWRGGQRSGSFASILTQIGWRAETISGGYRSYRRLVVQMLHKQPLPHHVVLLDGNTGTAKTELLALAAARGVQVLDLEGLARHRGSLFGAMTEPQPAQKAFESGIAAVLAAADPARPLLIEAESSRVGELIVPPSLWAAMCAAPRFEVRAPRSARAGYLTRTYADIAADPARLSDTLAALRPFVAAERLTQWHALAAEGAFQPLADALMEHHYDPRYLRQRLRHAKSVMAVLDAPGLSPGHLAKLADQLAALLAPG